MKAWQVSDLEMDVNAILRGQGANPEIIRQRSPRLIENAEKALKLVLPHHAPRILVEELKVWRFSHKQLVLMNGKVISGLLVTDYLIGIKRIAVVLFTVGLKIVDLAEETMKEDLVLGLALEGVGSATIAALANVVCRKIEGGAAAREMECTTPLSPGMIGWSVEEGQPVIFDLAESSTLEIQMTPFHLMVPRKSLSMIMGIGPNISSSIRICDCCEMRETCRCQDILRGRLWLIQKSWL